MYLFVLFKKILKIVYTRVACRRDRIPASLHESLDTTPDRRSVWRRYFIIFLFIPTFYFVYIGSTFEISGSGIHKINHLKPSKYDIQVNINTNISRIYTDYTTTKKPKIIKKSQLWRYPEKTDCKVPILGPRGYYINIYDSPNDMKLAANTLFVKVKMGGYFTPSDCIPRHKVGILVPYRNRHKNLAAFLYNMHPFLMKQKLEYRIFVIEQDGTDIFNKGRLFNAGYKEMMKFHKWQCIIFHDVDLLPMNAGILYTCPHFPRHMCGSVVQKENIPLYRSLFGGVTAILTEHFEKVNGYSNCYWGWGGEDNDMFRRLRSSGFPVVRYNKTLARYSALPHPMRGPNPHRYKLLVSAMDRRKVDGLSDIKYNVTSIKILHLYTHIVIDVNPDHLNITSLLEEYP